MTRISKLILVFICIGLLFACDAGTGEGDVRGQVSIESCDLEKDDFNLRVSFFSATYFDNRLTIRLQRKGRLQTHADGIIIDVKNVDEVNEHLGEPLSIDLSPPLEVFMDTGPQQGVGSETIVPVTPYSSPARATLYLNETCPDNRLAFTDGTGTITFESIYQPDGSSRIAGTFELTFIDPRTWEASGEVRDTATLEGEFEFEYDNNPQEQPFV